MARALELAQLGLYTTDPNPRVGCVLVSHGAIVGEGWHERAGLAHAEAIALAAAGAAARGATAYVSLEPCCHTGRTAPCADALIDAGVAKVVCPSPDPNPLVAGGGITKLRAAGIEVQVGVGQVAARELNIGFFYRFERGRPFVRLKLAASLDGRTALANGKSQWITGSEARADAHALRARSSAIMTGAGTVRADDPRLNVRLKYADWIRQPRRVVLDSRLSLPATAAVFAAPGATVFCAEGANGEAARGSVLERVAFCAGGLDLTAVLQRLAAVGCNELLVECGPRLAASLLKAQLVDELILYLAPTLLGADAQPLAELTGLASLAAAPRFEITGAQACGADLRISLRTGF
jgi:diaminohydroxyphosphoribosylaminopyrimidine deaminase/5-amino-6-(5-phosphoribosylamino)uracil reductase